MPTGARTTDDPNDPSVSEGARVKLGRFFGTTDETDWAPRQPGPDDEYYGDPSVYMLTAGGQANKLGIKVAAWSAPMLVEGVTIGGWSSKAGINEGDEILKMNYAKINTLSKNEIINNVTQVRPLTMHFRRGPEKKLGSAGFLRRNLGAGKFVCQAVSQDYDLGVDFTQMQPPIVVMDVEPGTWGEDVGLQIGDTLLEVNGKSVKWVKSQKLVQLIYDIKSRPVTFTFAPGDKMDEEELSKWREKKAAEREMKIVQQIQ